MRARHGAEAAGARRRVRELQTDGEERAPHLAVPEVVGERPRRLPGLGHRAAVQRVALGAPLLREHERAVVQAVPDADKVAERGESVAAEVRDLGREGLAITTDIRDFDQVNALVERTVKELGGLDILVNNAGGTRYATFLELEQRWKDWIRDLPYDYDPR